MEKLTEETKKPVKPSKKLITVLALCVVAAIILVGSFFTYAASYSKALPNIYIRGINIGGMTAEEISKTAEDAFGSVNSNRSVTLLCCGNERLISFDELNFEIDIQKTAEAAYRIGREKGSLKKVFKFISLVFNPEHLNPTVNFDEAKFSSIIAEMSDRKEILPTEAEYILDGSKLIIFKARDGKMIDRAKAAEKLVLAAIDPSVIKISLELETVKAKTPDLDEFYQKLTSPVKNAEYVLENGDIRIEPENICIKVEKSKIKEALTSNQEQYELLVEAEIPEVTAEELQELLFRDTLGSFSTSFATSTYERANNVSLTANRINGKILMPGDVFSYDTTIGKRTAANGYKEAGVYIGNKVESGIGGGICQTSSTLYSAVLYSNLEIVSRTSHSLPVSYIPLGQDATIAEGYIDFKFKNNTEYPVKIIATINARRLTCSIVGVKSPDISVQLINTITSTSEPKTERTENAEIPKGYKRILNNGAKGYTVASQRIVKQSGKIIKTEQLTKSVYRAAPVEEEVNPQDINTPTEELKVYVPGMEIPEEATEASGSMSESDPITPDKTENSSSDTPKSDVPNLPQTPEEEIVNV